MYGSGGGEGGLGPYFFENWPLLFFFLSSPPSIGVLTSTHQSENCKFFQEVPKLWLSYGCQPFYYILGGRPKATEGAPKGVPQGRGPQGRGWHCPTDGASNTAGTPPGTTWGPRGVGVASEAAETLLCIADPISP